MRMMREQQGRTHVVVVLDMIDRLDDEDLCVVVARAQARLLDRPIPPFEMQALAVEVVGRDEGHVLACYRALTPHAQEYVRRYVASLADTGAPLAVTRATTVSRQETS